jgi:histidyl-tRNA synthetase
VDLIPEQESLADAVVLILEPGTAALALLLQQQLVTAGKTVRLERRPKNLKALLEQLGENGFREFAIVSENLSELSELDFKQIG